MTPEEITTAFATAAASFQPIVGQPTDDDLTLLRETLYPLLLEIPYDETPPPGVHNLIGLVEPTTSYTATWGAPFPIPVRPPTYPLIPDAATPVVRARAEAEHAVLVADYACFEAAERAAAKFIRDVVDEIWYRDLRHARSFYTNVTAKQLMDHLDANCGGLHPSELVNLPTEMMSYYAKADGIPEYIDMLEEAQRKLARANLPMSDETLLAIASTSVLASQHFTRQTNEWEAKPPAEKTWAAWKPHYRAAHLARKRQQLATNNPAFGGGTAHVAATGGDAPLPHKTFARLDGYLDNLASAATTERTTLTQLIESNASLVASVATLTASLNAITAAYNRTPAPLAAAPAPTPAQAPAAATVRVRRPRTPLDPNGYCWTHGFRVAVGHSSATCTNKMAGHQDNATRANTMGGSGANKPT